MQSWAITNKPKAGLYHNLAYCRVLRSGTIFSGTQIPLQKWFLAIGLMVPAKKSLSSCQLARDLEMNQKTAWYMQQRIRAAMANDQGKLLQGIIEADETYLGGKPRHKDQNNKRGRGACGKTSVVGAVERKGDVKATVTDDTKGATVLGFIEHSVASEESALITDEYKAYINAYKLMPHRVINHGEGYVDADDKTLPINTIEGFWSLLKRAWYGSHHKYTRDWSPLFVAEACWKYNHRKDTDSFNGLLRACFTY